MLPHEPSHQSHSLPPRCYASHPPLVMHVVARHRPAAPLPLLCERDDNAYPGRRPSAANQRPYKAELKFHSGIAAWYGARAWQGAI